MTPLLMGASAATLGVMLVVALYNLLTAPRLHRARAAHDRPLVSILVPARDEASNLEEMLPLLLRQGYERLEIVVLDDGSSDATARVARGIGRGDDRLRVVTGDATPSGWVGKNWACAQLARLARGDVLIFCDADVHAARGAVQQTISLMHEHSAAVATAIPRQRFSGWLDRAVVPLVTQLPVAALLPLRLASRSPRPSLVMGNGQWMAFTRSAYHRTGGHEAVRGEVVEDLVLARRAKEVGVRVVMAAAPRTLEVTMYRRASDVREGFTKNLYPLMGGRWTTVSVLATLHFLVLIVPWAVPLAIGSAGWLPLALLLALRLASGALFGMDIRSLALHPLGSVALAFVAAASIASHRAKNVTWKGRTVPT